jgi:hypothetical protein
MHTGAPSFEAMRPLCKEVCLEQGARLDVVLFYVARWCQKKRDADAADAELREAAGKIAHNLVADGPLVDRLVDGDAAAWTELRGVLLASARPRAGGEAAEFADEALQKVAVVLLTGTPPSRAAEQLHAGPKGPRNEYVFTSPFEFWARAVVINLIVDEQRRIAREREGIAPVGPGEGAPLDRALLKSAANALPGLVAAIRELPRAQRSVLVLSLSRRELDVTVRERLNELAPDLFSLTEAELPSSDRDIAERLETIPRRVAANRSVGRRKLARRDPLWALLLDVLLPHKTTRPISEAANA